MGVRVTAKEFANADLVATYARDSYTLIKNYLGDVPEPDFRDVTVLDDYAGAEYGAVTQDGLAAIELMKKTEGIQLETTYTGKTLAGLIDYTRKHDLKDTPILFWNTYNSVDVSKYLKRGITYKDLPEVFHKNFKEDLLHKK
ncbi:MAG: hypothetical protein Q6366_006035, partial [Candidatus Freyarchaeota archaeon]